MDAAHTPGPWTLLPRDTGLKPAVQRGVEGGFSIQGLSDKREDADARLIASAPDLLEALQSVHDRLMECSILGIGASDAYDSFYQEVVSSAIAKATGSQP